MGHMRAMTAAPTLRSPQALADAGLIAPERLPALESVAAQYAVAITPALAELIDPADPADPIARQFLPAEAELEMNDLESADPIGDFTHSPVEGIVHRYPDRVLLKTELVAGHGGVSGRYAIWRDIAFEYAWLVAATGGEQSATRFAEGALNGI